MHFFRSLSRSNEGATAIEYGLIAALIAVALIVGIGGFSDALLNVFVVNAPVVERKGFTLLPAHYGLLCITQHRDVGIVSGENELSQLLPFQQLVNKVAVERFVVQIVFRLVYQDDRVPLQVHKNMQYYRGPLSE